MDVDKSGTWGTLAACIRQRRKVWHYAVAVAQLIWSRSDAQACPNETWSGADVSSGDRDAGGV